MVTLKYSCGFWFFLRDGEEIGNTGRDQVEAAERKTGLKSNHASILDLDVIAAVIGPDAVKAVADYRATLPAPRRPNKREERAWHYHTLKGH